MCNMSSLLLLLLLYNAVCRTSGEIYFTIWLFELSFIPPIAPDVKQKLSYLSCNVCISEYCHRILIILIVFFFFIVVYIVIHECKCMYQENEWMNDTKLLLFIKTQFWNIKVSIHFYRCNLFFSKVDIFLFYPEGHCSTTLTVWLEVEVVLTNKLHLYNIISLQWKMTVKIILFLIQLSYAINLDYLFCQKVCKYESAIYGLILLFVFHLKCCMIFLYSKKF